MPFQLVVVRGRSTVNHHRLGLGVTVAGRQDGCQLQIKSSQVSRKHCEFFEKDDQLLIKDLNSSNGTFVNDEKVTGQRTLSDGDEVTIGGVKFRVESLGAGAAGPADTAVPLTVTPGASDSGHDDDTIALDDGETLATASPVKETKDTDNGTSTPDIGEDAVAEFLMDLDVDENDKT